MPINTCEQLDDWRPIHFPVSPTPWWPVPVVQLGLHMTRLSGNDMQTCLYHGLQIALVTHVWLLHMFYHRIHPKRPLDSSIQYFKSTSSRTKENTIIKVWVLWKPETLEFRFKILQRQFRSVISIVPVEHELHLRSEWFDDATKSTPEGFLCFDRLCSWPKQWRILRHLVIVENPRQFFLLCSIRSHHATQQWNLKKKFRLIYVHILRLDSLIGNFHCTHSRKINRSRNDMNVHKVIDDARLYVTFVLVNKNLLAGIEYLHVAQFRLGVFVQRFVSFLIVLYSLQKVPKGNVRAHALVVRTVDFYFLRNSMNNVKIINVHTNMSKA